MALLTRTNTFTDGTTAYGSQVETEISNVVNTLNNLDADTQKWTNLDASTAIKFNGQNIVQWMSQRRPVLQYNSGTVVSMETGLNGTSGQALIVFPDGTYRTDSTGGRINCNLAQVAALTGTAQSGLDTGTVATNRWYSFYAVKSQVNTTDIVHVATLNQPTQANFAALNTAFGTNSWVYLGTLPNGDGASGTVVPKFVQVGHRVVFYNIETNSIPGVRLANTAGATSLTWTYASGNNLGSAQVPANFVSGSYIGRQGVTTVIAVTDSAAGYSIYSATWSSAAQIYPVTEQALTAGLKINPGASVAIEIMLNSYTDGALGIGVPLL